MSRSWPVWLILVALLTAPLVLAGPGLAATSPDELLEDPALEKRARDLGKELRCLVCQNQSIDDSDAQLARDLRGLVREQLVEGKSDTEIKDYLVARYGEFVLLKPPVAPATYLLWVGPFAILFMAAGWVWLRGRKSFDTSGEALLATGDQQPLSAAERAELAKIVGEPDNRPNSPDQGGTDRSNR